MASSQDLKEVLKESLENRGTLAEIKARIRAEVFTALDDKSEGKPPLSNDNVLIFELIREFLDYNHCKFSSSVLVSETGLPRLALDREFLRNELNIVEDAPSKSVPLLYSLISTYKNTLSKRNQPQQFLPPENIGMSGNRRGPFHHEAADIKEDMEHPPVIIKGGHL